MSKDKASWDESSTGIFIKECIEQIYMRERQGSSFTGKGWKAIIAAFNEKTGKSYDKKQFKNRFDNLKKEWKAWDQLFSKETGIAFDYSKNRVIAEDEWWDRKIKENPAYEKYRFRGLKFARELEIMFKDVMASGEHMFTPSATHPVSLGDDEDQVYRPTMDLEEGSGDSEEELAGATTGGSVGLTGDLNGMTFRTNSQPSAPSGSGSVGKRKRGEGSRTSKRPKMPASSRIADAVSQMVDVAKDRVDSLKKMSNNDPREMLTELVTMPEIAADPDFCLRCCNMMMHEQCRIMFDGIKANKDALLGWLRHHAYNSPAFQSPPPS